MNKMMDNVLRGGSLKMRAVRMSGLGGIGKGGEAVLRLIGNIILAKLLFPEAFGLMALVTLVTGAAMLFSDVGISEALIRNPRADERSFRDTAWTLKVLRGFVLAGIVLALANPFAALYGEEMLAPLVSVASLLFVIKGFQSTKVENARRHLTIGRLTVIQLVAKVVATAAMVVLALATGSVWSFVIGSIIGSVVLCALSHFYLPGPLDRPRLEREAIWQIFDLGRFILVSTAATYVSNRGMTALLGFFLALGTLGQFNMALALSALPTAIGQVSLNNVLLSLYSNRPDDGTETRARSRRLARRLTALASAAMLLLFALLVPPFVGLLYDERYDLLGPITLLLCVAALPDLLGRGYRESILARGEGTTHMYGNLIGAVGQLGFVYGGIMMGGLLGAIIGQAFGRAAPLLVIIPAQRRVGEFDLPFDVAFSLGCCLAASAVCWVHWPEIEILLAANAGTVPQP